MSIENLKKCQSTIYFLRRRFLSIFDNGKNELINCYRLIVIYLWFKYYGDFQQDGGVFTCGAGMYGQLGHGSNSNEILPRQVMELMGSVVTQISCGKRHVIALVPSRGRVYAWGLGGAGQLGTRVTRTVSTPQVVLGPWVSPNGSSIYTVDNPITEHSSDCVVKYIFCGGDHCFATVTKREV